MTNPNQLPPPNGLSKIILQTHRDERGNDVGTVAAREDNGLIIGAAMEHGEVRWGIGTNQVGWFFLDYSSGLKHLKECCREYLDREDVDFMVQTAGKLIQASGDSLPQGIRRRM